MDHPFAPQMKNKELKFEIENSLHHRGDTAFTELFEFIEDKVQEVTGYLVGDISQNAEEDEVLMKAMRMVVLKKLQMHIEFNLLSKAEKASKLFFWEIHTTHNDKL